MFFRFLVVLGILFVYELHFVVCGILKWPIVLELTNFQRKRNKARYYIAWVSVGLDYSF